MTETGGGPSSYLPSFCIRFRVIRSRELRGKDIGLPFQLRVPHRRVQMRFAELIGLCT
jgi:hypothetical protein